MTIRQSVEWLFDVLELPDKIPQSTFEDLIKKPIHSKSNYASKWSSWRQSSFIHSDDPIVFAMNINPLLRDPPIIKAFITGDTKKFEIEIHSMPGLEEIHFRSLANVPYVFIHYLDTKQYYYSSFQLTIVAIPTLNDIERLELEENREVDYIAEIKSIALVNQPKQDKKEIAEVDYLSEITGMALADQLTQEIEEARSCRDYKLPISTIATLSIAMETACKVVLESRKIPYKKTKDGLNDLLNILTNHGLLSERDMQAALAQKGMRNSIDHGHSGIVEQPIADTFFTSGEHLIRKILKSVLH